MKFSVFQFSLLRTEGIRFFIESSKPTKSVQEVRGGGGPQQRRRIVMDDLYIPSKGNCTSILLLWRSKAWDDSNTFYLKGNEIAILLQGPRYSSTAMAQ